MGYLTVGSAGLKADSRKSWRRVLLRRGEAGKLRDPLHNVNLTPGKSVAVANAGTVRNYKRISCRTNSVTF